MDTQGPKTSLQDARFAEVNHSALAFDGPLSARSALAKGGLLWRSFCLASWLAVGCSSGDPSTNDPEPCPIGDMSAPVELELLYRSPDGQQHAIEAGQRVPLIKPPQGGKIVVVGVRARNVDCHLNVSAGLLDPCDRRVVGFEKRPIKLGLGADGWGQPEFPNSLSAFSNIPACPAANILRNVRDQTHILQVKIEDQNERGASLEVEVVPFCAEPQSEAMCLCECDRNFIGTGCSPDSDAGAVECPAGAN